MPTYEYECNKCGLRFERRQSMSDGPLSECPECKGGVRRLVSGGVGFIIKGSIQDGTKPSGNECSMERIGKTCCGRDERCGKSSCGDRK